MVQRKQKKGEYVQPFNVANKTDAEIEAWNEQEIARRKKVQQEEAKTKHEASFPYQASDGERFRTKRQAQEHDAKLQKKKNVADAQKRYNTRTATLEDINLLEDKKVLRNVQASRYRIEKKLNEKGSMEAYTDSSNVIPGYTEDFKIKAEKDKAFKKELKDKKKEEQAKLKKESEDKDKAVATKSATIKQHNMLKASYDKDYKAMEEIADWVEAKEEWDPVEQGRIKTPAGWKSKTDLTPKEKADFEIKVQNLETKKKKLGSYIGPKEEATTPLHPKTKQPIKAFSF